MTILVDTNVLPRTADANSLELNVLLAIARETGHDVALPSLVVEEAVGQLRRAIEDAFDTLLVAHRAARRYATIPLLGELPVPGEVAQRYEEELLRRFTIAALPESAGDEALRREVHRLRPTREGAGARDAAIWLTVKDVHATTGGPTYFISENTKDFGADDGQSLHPDLRDEIDRLNGGFHYFRSVSDVLEHLATPDPPLADIAFLNDVEAARRAATRALEQASVLQTLGVPAAIDDTRRGNLFIAGPVDGRATDVSESRGFRVEGRRVTVAWSKWEFSFAAGVTISSGPGAAQRTCEMKVRAALQFLIRTDDDGSVDADVLDVRGVRRLEPPE